MILHRTLFADAFVVDFAGPAAAQAQIGVEGRPPGQPNPIGYIPSKQSSA